MALTVLFVYLGFVLAIGLFSNRFLRRTSEDYFVAARSIGPVVLLLSLFGTNMTAFAILGASGESYQEGIGVFGLMASISALVIPCILFFVGTRIWALGKKYGYITPIQYFRERWESDALGLLIFFAMVVFVIPHLLTAPMGGGLALRTLTATDLDRAAETGLPLWVGAALICVPVLLYVFFGGLRGTVWVQSFETLVFIIVGLIALVVVVSKLGGIQTIMREVAADETILQISAASERPVTVSKLLAREGIYQQLEFFSYILIPFSVGMFPHMWIHLLAARSLNTFRVTIVAYPLCIAAVWIPSVLLGVLGAWQHHDLTSSPQINSVLIRLINENTPGILGPLVGAAVFAAIMSTLDSQILSLGSMFTQDIVAHYGYHDRISETKQVWVGRAFVVALLVLVFVVALKISEGPSARRIFAMSIWSFSAFTSLFPVVVAAIFWKRSTKYGAFASVLSVAILVPVFFVGTGFGASKTINLQSLLGLSEPLEFLPVLIIAPVSALMMIVVSLVTSPPSAKTLQKFYPETT